MAKRKDWKDLTIIDDYMFKLVMMYPHICKHLIEAVWALGYGNLDTWITRRASKIVMTAKG